MPFRIKFPIYRMPVQELDAETEHLVENLISVELTPEEYNPNLMATCENTIAEPTPTKIYDTFNNDYDVPISKNFANYLAACLCELQENKRAQLSDDFAYRGYSPYYNPATLVKNERGEPIATDLALKQFLLVDGQPIPRFPDIYISDEGCNPEYLLEKHKDQHLIIIDLIADMGAATWHAKLGLDHASAEYHESGQGLRCMEIPDYDADIYDALRKHSAKKRNFIDSTHDNIEESFIEILTAITQLLENPKQPQAIIIKCLEGKDRSPSFAFLYVVAWLYKFANIELSSKQCGQLKFLISIQTGPCSPLEFVEKLKKQVCNNSFETLEKALYQGTADLLSTQSQPAPLSDDECRAYSINIREFLEAGLSLEDIKYTLMSSDSRLSSEIIDTLFEAYNDPILTRALPTQPGTGKPADQTTFGSVGSSADQPSIHRHDHSDSAPLPIPRNKKTKSRAPTQEQSLEEKRALEKERKNTIKLFLEAHNNERFKLSLRTNIDPSTATIDSIIENALRERQSIFSLFAKDRSTVALRACLSIGLLVRNQSGEIIPNPHNKLSRHDVLLAYDKAKEKLKKEQPDNENIRKRGLK